MQCVESKRKKIKPRKTGEKWLPRTGEWGRWGEFGKRVRTFSCKKNKSEDLMYNMGIRVDNTVLCN